MRTPGPLCATGLLLLVTLGCKEPQRGSGVARANLNPAGQTLRVYNFANYFGPSTLPQFEESTGAKVAVETYTSNEELMQALEGGARYDVVFPSSYAVERLIARGQLRTMDRDRVPNLIQVPERFRNPPVDPGLAHCIPYTWSLAGIGLHAPRETHGRDPDSLAVLFAERGPRVVMMDDMRAALGTALRFLGHSANTRDAGEIAAARDLLMKQLPRVLRYAGDTAPALVSSEATLALSWSGDVMAAQRERPDVHFVLPREGTLINVDYACVPQSAPSPGLAFAFLNHLLEPQVAAEITNSQLFATPNTGAQKLLRQDAKWLWGTLDAVKEEGRFEMIRDVGPATPEYTAAWQALRARVPFAAR